MERDVEDVNIRTIERVQAVLAKRTIAIYHQTEGGNPVQEGSAVLLRVAGVGFAVSAGHVLKTKENTALGLAPMEGTSPFLWTNGSGNRSRIVYTNDQDRGDSPDLGFIRLPSSITDALLQHKEFISLGDIVHQPLSRSEMYAVYGYPISATRTDYSRGRIEVGVFSYGGSIQEPTDDYPERCINLPCTTTSIAKTDSTGSSSARIPYLKGISGCGFWQLDRTGRRLPLLAGIEHTVVERVRILGTVARFLPGMIAREHSDLRSSIRVTCPEA